MDFDTPTMIIDGATENWLENKIPGPVENVVVEVTQCLTSDKVFNAAAFLKSEFGDQYAGMLEQDWYRVAETIFKILGGK